MQPSDPRTWRIFGSRIGDLTAHADRIVWKLATGALTYRSDFAVPTLMDYLAVDFHFAGRYEASHFSEEPMKRVVLLLAIAGAGWMSLALADPPAVTQAAPTSSTTPAPITPASPTVPATPETPAVSPKEAASATSASSTEAVHQAQLEKQLHARGYSPQMHNGERVFCRRESPIGSHLSSVLNCVTPAEAERIASNAQGDTEKVQKKMNGCLMNGNGRSANCGD